MKAFLTLYRFCLASLAGGGLIGLLLGAAPALAANNVTFIADWGQTFSLPAPALIRYGTYTESWCPADSTCFNQGMGGQWSYKVLSGPNILCADREWWSTPGGAFPTDSYPGRTKRCELVVQYGNYKFAAAQGAQIPFTVPEYVYFGMYDSNGSATGTFKGKWMTEAIMCNAESFGLAPAGPNDNRACFKELVPFIPGPVGSTTYTPPPTSSLDDMLIRYYSDRSKCLERTANPPLGVSFAYGAKVALCDFNNPNQHFSIKKLNGQIATQTEFFAGGNFVIAVQDDDAMFAGFPEGNKYGFATVTTMTLQPISMPAVTNQGFYPVGKILRGSLWIGVAPGTTTFITGTTTSAALDGVWMVGR